MEGLTPSEEWMGMWGREGEGVEQEEGWVELYLVYKVKKNFETKNLKNSHYHQYLVLETIFLKYNF